ncbi:hypothetical protein K488DRAFT_51444 [Vararia minispora EC-137]|uniref:Uncharacterized protein n=1 Tax=Vararia minispora EC-137 TaxID=1314806 RepID=A0ACB8QJD3_9AGAM|nr:hypothetical protein K488DRAFT_51444 [Vararia minispora EC-137]
MTIRVETGYQPPSTDGIPALALQAICLVNSYMLWIGITEEDGPDAAIAAGKLTADWACAIPPIGVSFNDTSATSLLRSSSSDLSLSVSQRLARRFKKQIFLSIDIPASLASSSQGARAILEAEKFLVKTLKELES